MNLKLYEYLGLVFGLFIALESSYIHPDEHFQTLEPVITGWTNIKGTTAWEFLPENAARSLTILRLYYSPMLWLNDHIFHVSPIGLLYLYRLQNYIIYTFVVIIFLEFCEVSVTHKTKAKFFIRTSYITWVFQSHTFSNSLETIVLLITLFICQLIVFEARKVAPSYKTCFLLGTAITIGTFNRVTFPAFLILPLLSVFYHCFINNWLALFYVIFTTLITSLLVVLSDSYLYEVQDRLVLTPLNNLLYNLNTDNISQHGLHPRYYHILINVPLICGPILVFFISKKYLIKLPTLSAISGVLFLSLFKHQELRFIIPILPLISVSINLANFDTVVQGDIIVRIWLLFNAIMGIVMGVFHQAGIIPLISEFSKKEIPVHIWWKTYSPPTWLYYNSNLTVSTTNFVENEEKVDTVNWEVVNNHVVDLKGADVSLLNETLFKFALETNSINLILPNSVLSKLKVLEKDWNFTKQWETVKHLDLDHIDLSHWESIKPGLSLYNVAQIL